VFGIVFDDALWTIWQTGPGGGWSEWQQLGGPGAAVKQIATARDIDGRLEVFGIGFDDALWHIRQTTRGGNWSQWEELG
jgi:hypothetical protein